MHVVASTCAGLCITLGSNFMQLAGILEVFGYYALDAVRCDAINATEHAFSELAVSALIVQELLHCTLGTECFGVIDHSWALCQIA